MIRSSFVFCLLSFVFCLDGPDGLDGLDGPMALMGQWREALFIAIPPKPILQFSLPYLVVAPSLVAVRD